jgi:hypothetical protein
MERETRMGRAGAMLIGLMVIAAAFAQPSAGPRPPLVPCEPGASGPCVQVATSPVDLVGVWKQFVGRPDLQAPGGMGFIRYRADGSFSLADTVEHTAEPYAAYPRGRVTFDGEVMTMVVDGDVPPECKEATFVVHVIRNGDQPVALHYQAVEDACMPRSADLAVPVIWVAP